MDSKSQQRHEDSRKRRRGTSDEGMPRPAFAANNQFYGMGMSSAAPTSLSSTEPNFRTRIMNPGREKSSRIPSAHDLGSYPVRPSMSSPRTLPPGISASSSSLLASTASNSPVKHEREQRANQSQILAMHLPPPPPISFSYSSDGHNLMAGDQLQPTKQSGATNYTISEDRTGGTSAEMCILFCALKTNGSLLDLAKAARGTKGFGSLVIPSAASPSAASPSVASTYAPSILTLTHQLALLKGERVYGCKVSRHSQSWGLYLLTLIELQNPSIFA